MNGRQRHEAAENESASRWQSWGYAVVKSSTKAACDFIAVWAGPPDAQKPKVHVVEIKTGSGKPSSFQRSLAYVCEQAGIPYWLETWEAGSKKKRPQRLRTYRLGLE